MRTVTAPRPPRLLQDFCELCMMSIHATGVMNVRLVVPFGIGWAEHFLRVTGKVYVVPGAPGKFLPVPKPSIFSVGVRLQRHHQENFVICYS